MRKKRTKRDGKEEREKESRRKGKERNETMCLFRTLAAIKNSRITE